MPAVVLVFVVFGALSFDAAVAFLGERQVANAAAAAANDATTRALDQEAFYRDGTIVVRPDQAEQVVRGSVAAEQLDHNGLEDVTVAVTVGLDGRSVTVEVSAWVPYVFSKAVPGGPDGVRVSASSTFEAVDAEPVLP